MSDKFRVSISTTSGVTHYVRAKDSSVLCDTGDKLLSDSAITASCSACSGLFMAEMRREFLAQERYEEVFLKILYRIPPLKGADDAVKMADRRASAALKHLKEREP